MKLRRALAAAATTAVIAPIALLSAPVAFATGDDPTPPVSEESTTAPAELPTEEPTAPTEEPSAPTQEETTPEEEETSPAPEETTSAPAEEEEDPAPEESASTSASPSPSESAPGDEKPWDPYEDCMSFETDENLTAQISGLPNKIVAGSGWHNFQFVATNDSDKDLKNVFIEAFTEYAGVNEGHSLSMDLAEVQVKEDGKWTSAFQESFETEDGEIHFTGSFAASLETLEANSTATLDLRVRVKASAPAGSSYTMSQAIYAGESSDICYGNGEFYEFKVLAAGSKPGDVDDAKPNGKKPSGIDSDKKPQGEVKEITGNLAETGSDSNLPVIATIGGIAIVAGAGVMFAMKRRKVGAEA
ncbi:LAETG motif-containing sortase-dependent surface protein [Streptomyces sp. UG1]|uniref:LAETG motif-containing sortase-dependent surface protein n=1 Tax=Streptomyces sp. UG1 TaxID=3417652 RepID=UPI003CEF65FB